MLAIQGLTASRGGVQVLRDVDLTIAPGRFTALIGPNGSGKSTLMAAMAGMLPVDSGRLLLDGKPLAALSRRGMAQALSFLPQHLNAPAGLTLRELVVQGRFPWRGWLSAWSPRDEAAVEKAVSLSRVGALMDRPLASLSGGQLQRAWIAMTLAQDTPVILLDEPTTFLDVASQLSLLDLLSQLRDDGRTIVAILHDLNQAARYADDLVMMRDGRVVAQGPSGTIFTTANLEQVFSIRAHMVTSPATGEQICVASSAGDVDA
ncbi:ABC transporter ATP-binding protein [Pseudotabrizicola sp. 4114]|uniref:ABC transporter ATP-binding protein n=1 Tax=Pseudotabrizicola sp. 4114 TaxID=2817731 RepID=UPI00286503B7|nr:iron complex transport system ATP-binding protein [Pseudorhodobacter sp. 4114]